MVAIGGLYFFAFGLADGSPLLNFFQTYASIAFGEIGVHVFFGLTALVWVLIMVKWYLMRVLIKQYVVLLLLLSAVFNFPIIDGEVWQYEQYGGYISWPLIWVMDTLFGWQAVAVKAFVLILVAGCIGWILYVFNFSLPRININLKSDTRPKRSSSSVSKVSAPRKTAEPTQSTRSTNNDSLLKNIIKQKAHERITEKEVASRPSIHFAKDKPTFDVQIMHSNRGQQQQIDESFLMEKAKSLQSKLAEFNVHIGIEWFDIGPSIVQIRIKPEAGIKISTIENLKNDIASSLKTKSLRVIAPIPGTDCVGIQIPNPKPSMVRLGDVLWSSDFGKSMKENYTNLALGKAIDGSIVIKSLESMPHLLIAWATGSGKSVGVNDFIISLMYQNSPSELKFLMVDPKQVELEFYTGLPYMLGPIVTDPDKALKLLKWSVDEMERRYTLLKDKRVKNIAEYNKKVMWDKLYRLVFVIDELADLMMSGNKKEVETCITRIAQKARAVGMHLIVATQRPQVSVITGLIKANMPTRIAFGVVSEVDSRTILGRQGAESLLGKWDMLYMDPSTKHPVRLQAPFVDTDETEKIVAQLKNKYMRWLSENDIYDPHIIQVLENKVQVWMSTFGSSSWGNGSDEELVQQAIQVIAQTRKASATLLQRKLNVWFARAARIMDTLEEQWVIGPQDGAKPRDIYL